MPTTRTPLKRRNRHRITPEAVEAFKAGLRTADQYLACNRGEACTQTTPFFHCATCRQYLEAARTLHRAIGLKPWECSPLDVDDGPAPVGGALWRESWPQAQELRRELLEAAGAARQ